jgi:hypothetical protein
MEKRLAVAGRFCKKFRIEFLRGHQIMKLLCVYLCVYIFSLLAMMPGVSAQTPTAFTIDGNPRGGFGLPSIVNIEADKPTTLAFSGRWPFACAPVALGHEIDTAKKIVLIKFKEAAIPCAASPNVWEYALPSTSFAFGRYDIVVRAEPAIVNGVSASKDGRTTRGYFFAYLAAGATIANQRLIANPGVADTEQFLEVTTLVFCGGPKLSATTTRNGNALEIRVNYVFGAPICPLLAPPNIPVSALMSIGKLPAGGYDVKVVNVFTDSSGAPTGSPQVITLQERLTINARNVAATTSLNGVWYDPNEPGWGMTITENNNTAFVTWYGYMDYARNNGIGTPFWYVMTGKRDGATIRGAVDWPQTGTDFRLKWDQSNYKIYYWGEAIITMLDADNIAVTTNFGPALGGNDLPLAIPYASVVTRNVSRLKF